MEGLTHAIGQIDAILASYWPTASDMAIGKPLNDATKYIASRSRPSLDWDRRS